VAVIRGVACGLANLHHEIHPPLIHHDVKAGNILLGSGDAAIADFGLAQMMLGGDEPGDNSTAAKGTLAPEYVQGGARFLSTKCDVYSFGFWRS
jgi:serine/threonine protein kinase